MPSTTAHNNGRKSFEPADWQTGRRAGPGAVPSQSNVILPPTEGGVSSTRAVRVMGWLEGGGRIRRCPSAQPDLVVQPFVMLFLRPLRGLHVCLAAFPRLTPWATFFCTLRVLALDPVGAWAADVGSARSARQNKVSRGSAEEREQSPRERAEELRHPPAPFLSSENSYTLGSLSQLGARRLVVALSSRNLDPQYSCTSHTQRMGRQSFVCVQIQSARHSSGPSL